MAEDLNAHDLYVECLTAMAASGGDYPCETLAPAPRAGCALPAAPKATAMPDRRAAAPAGQTGRN